MPHQFDGHSLLPFVHGAPPARWRKAARYEYDVRDMASRKAAAALGIDPDATSLACVLDDDFAYIHFAQLPPLLLMR